MTPWYLLFDGTSVDGRGPATYCGRTTDQTIARFHKKNCDNDFYSVGYVVVVTDDQHCRVFDDNDWPTSEIAAELEPSSKAPRSP